MRNIDLQLSIVNPIFKLGLIFSWVAHSFITNSTYFSFGFYHFISLYGMMCFLVSFYFEYKRSNLFFSIVSLIGLISYQPFYSVLKFDFYGNEVRINEIVIQLTLIVIPWAVYDIIRSIKDYKKSKKHLIKSV